MKFGSFYFFQLPPGRSHAQVVRDEVDEIAWADELGFDHVWVTEHHFIEYGLAVDPALLAAVAALRTRRARIGIAAAILPFQSVVLISAIFVFSPGSYKAVRGVPPPQVATSTYQSAVAWSYVLLDSYSFVLVWSLVGAAHVRFSLTRRDEKPLGIVWLMAVLSLFAAARVALGALARTIGFGTCARFFCIPRMLSSPR